MLLLLICTCGTKTNKNAGTESYQIIKRAGSGTGGRNPLCGRDARKGRLSRVHQIRDRTKGQEYENGDEKITAKVFSPFVQ
jgi:hypothetical protein